MYQALLWNQPLEIETTEGLFSPRGADAGTLSMVSAVELESGQKLLDLGCGAGLVGIAAAKVLGEENVWMTDVDPAAVRCAAENAKRNGVENVHLCCGDALDAVDASGFDWILSNPPYHADFSVAKKFIEKGFNRLKLGGKLVMVVKRELWYRNNSPPSSAGCGCRRSAATSFSPPKSAANATRRRSPKRPRPRPAPPKRSAAPDR